MARCAEEWDPSRLHQLRKKRWTACVASSRSTQASILTRYRLLLLIVPLTLMHRCLKRGGWLHPIQMLRCANGCSQGHPQVQSHKQRHGQNKFYLFVVCKSVLSLFEVTNVNSSKTKRCFLTLAVMRLNFRHSEDIGALRHISERGGRNTRLTRYIVYGF